MKKIKLKKLNNQGSTFVLAIIVITLVTLLAVSILGASRYNIAMKNVDRNSKVTFYTAETIVDEVCAGTGVDSMTFLAKAYENVITTLVSTEDGTSDMMSNDDANKKFKTIFIESMLQRISGKTFPTDKNMYIISDINDRDVAINYLENFIKGHSEGLAYILSIGNIEAYKEETNGRAYMIIVRDVAIQYKEEKNGETFFSNITTDLEIHFPNMTVNFTATNRLKDFIKYVFIADNNINIPAYDLTANGSLYAGNRIEITAQQEIAPETYRYGSASLTLDKLNPLANNINVICGGNSESTAGTISLMGTDDYKATFEADGTDIWCTNILTDKDWSRGTDSSKGTVIDIGNDCSTYVKDDLTVNGPNSDVTVFGEYYGYSHDGYHSNSSAMIINAKRAKLEIGASKLLLAGHSYVQLSQSASNPDYYMLGEALSFRGDQEIYLVPTEYLGYNYGTPIPNPMSEETWLALKTKVDATASYTDDDKKVLYCNLDGFFAEEKGYLASKPYEAKQVGKLVYVYLNFKTKADAARYIHDVANGTNGAPLYLQNHLDKYTTNLFEGDDRVVTVSDDTQLLVNGAVLTSFSKGDTLGTGSSESDEKTMPDWVASGSSSLVSNDLFSITSLDLENRYSIFTHLLADIPWVNDEGKKYIVNNILSALLDKKNYTPIGEEMYTTTVFENIVDDELIKKSSETFVYGSANSYVQAGSDLLNYIKVIKKGDFTIPEDCNGGIVVATGTVTVQSDFDGMIIAGNHITISDNVTVSNNAAHVEMLLTMEYAFEDESIKEDIPFKEYFHAYKHAATEDDSKEAVKVEEVDYKDIVKTNNWRKYED